MRNRKLFLSVPQSMRLRDVKPAYVSLRSRHQQSVFLQNALLRLVSCAQIHLASELISAKNAQTEPSFGAITCACAHAASSKLAKCQSIANSALHFQLASVTTPVDVDARMPKVSAECTAKTASTHASARLTLLATFHWLLTRTDCPKW